MAHAARQFAKATLWTAKFVLLFAATGLVLLVCYLMYTGRDRGVTDQPIVSAVATHATSVGRSVQGEVAKVVASQIADGRLSAVLSYEKASGRLDTLLIIAGIIVALLALLVAVLGGFGTLLLVLIGFIIYDSRTDRTESKNALASVKHDSEAAAGMVAKASTGMAASLDEMRGILKDAREYGEGVRRNYDLSRRRVVDQLRYSPFARRFMLPSKKKDGGDEGKIQ